MNVHSELLLFERQAAKMPSFKSKNIDKVVDTARVQ